MTIEELDLTPVAENAARLFQQKYPHLEFTSGRRNIPQQAHARHSSIRRPASLAGTLSSKAPVDWPEAVVE